ncbi:MAG: hypothetical protein HKN37_13725 [Rhodothermales bacterium]|nr:hypothetical protein [Acidimicrobiia bacterium]NNE47708.1 hypothetical protein [Rhodothermales bacterium]
MKPPKPTVYLAFGVGTVQPLAERPSLLAEVFDGFPAALVPTHVGFYEPIRTKFRLEDQEALLSPCWSPRGDLAHFVYRGDVRGFGSLATRRGRGIESNRLVLRLQYERAWRRNLVRYVQPLLARAMDCADASAGFATVYSDYPGGDMYVDHKPGPVELMGVAIGNQAVAGAGLVCIHPFAWLNVFGEEYSEYIGRQRLMSLDVFDSWEDARKRIWIKMCEWPHELYEPELLAHRDALVASLNLGEALCDQGRLVDYRWVHTGPEFDRSQLRQIGSEES